MPEPVSEFAVGQPSPALRPFVERYVGYRQELPETAGLHRGLPGRHLTLIISLAEPVDIVAMPDPAQAPGALAAFACGLCATPALIRRDRVEHGVHLDLTPLGARALLGLPAGALGPAVVDLADLLGATAGELVDRLACGPGWPQRFAVLDEVLASSAGDPTGAPAEVEWAWRRLVSTGGRVGVGALADEVGWSRRHLGQRFRQELGLSPKVAARVLRFERSRSLLQRRDRPDLATVAATCGYFDQAHLARDWRALAGCAPSTWLAEELPFVQDDPPPAGAG